MTWADESNRDLLAEFAIWLTRKKIIIEGFQWDDLVARFIAERKVKAVGRQNHETKFAEKEKSS